MQKFWIKNKDKLWTLPVLAILSWIFNKLLDFLHSNLITIDVHGFISAVVNFLNYKISILSIISGFLGVIFVYKIFERIKTSKRKLRIIKAVYGRDLVWLDITNELNRAVENDKLIIVLSNNIAGDPLVGVQKIGVIKYQYDGKIEEETFIEGVTINLP